MIYPLAYILLLFAACVVWHRAVRPMKGKS